MESAIIYVLMLFFAFYLLNYADITARPSAWLKRVLGPKLGYPLHCAFCIAFWPTLVFWAFGWAPLYLVFISPVLHLFVDLVYTQLGGAQKPVSSGEPPLLITSEQRESMAKLGDVMDAYYGTATTPPATLDKVMEATREALGKQPDTIKLADFDLFWGLGKTWSKPELIGKPVTVVSDLAWDPRGRGRVKKGRVGILEKVSPVTCAWAYYVTATDGLDDFCVGSFSDLSFNLPSHDR